MRRLLARFWELIELVLWTEPAAVRGLPDSRETGKAIEAIMERDRRLAGKARIRARRACQR